MKKNAAYRDMDMCSGALFSKILIFALPVMLSNVLQIVYNAADGIVVGQFEGDLAFAAVSSNGSLINLITSLVMGLAVGANSVAACLYGAGDKDGVHRTVHTSVMLSIIGGIIIGAFGYIFCVPLLRLMQTPETLLPLSEIYMKITFIGLPAVSLLNFGSAILRAVGDTAHPTMYLIISGLLNVLLNIFFVGVLHIGVAGVAIATIISQVFAAVLTVRRLMHSSDCFKLSLRELKIHKNELLRILRVGIPAGIQSSAFSLSNVFIQSSINTLGDAAVAGGSAAANINNFIYMAQNAFYHASISFCAQNYGAGKPKRVLRSLLYCTLFVTVIGLGIGLIIFAFGQGLLHVFVTEELSLEYAREIMRITTVWYFLCGIMEVGSGALRGINRSMISTVGSLVGSCLLRIVWIMTVFAANRTLFVLYISYPISWILTSIFHYSVFFICFRKLSKAHTEEQTKEKEENGSAIGA